MGKEGITLGEYRTLKSLYYEDKNTYTEAYLSRFNGPGAVKIDFLVGNNQAFFTQNDEVTKLMFSILRLDKEIAKLYYGLPPIALKQYSQKCLIDEIVITNNIEGVYSSRKEISEALRVLEEQSAERGKERRFLGMVNKYSKLLRRDTVQLAGCKDIRDIYDELVLKEVVEENPENAPDGKLFRKGSTTIYSATDKPIHNGAMPEKKIVELLDKALTFLNDESVEMLYRICLFHYMIEYIHPFYDGNGRLGRFILSYCISYSLTDILAYRISETIKENISSYYAAFATCNDPRNRGELTPFLTMMLEMIEKSCMHLASSLKEKATSWGRFERIAENLVGADNKQTKQLYSILIQAALFGEKGVPIKGLMEFTNLSEGTIRNKLNIIQSQGLLVEGKSGKAKLYQINLEALNALWLDS